MVWSRLPHSLVGGISTGVTILASCLQLDQPAALGIGPAAPSHLVETLNQSRFAARQAYNECGYPCTFKGSTDSTELDGVLIVFGDIETLVKDSKFVVVEQRLDLEGKDPEPLHCYYVTPLEARLHAMTGRVGFTENAG